MTKGGVRYYPGGTTVGNLFTPATAPRTVRKGRVVVHNQVRPVARVIRVGRRVVYRTSGFPDVYQGQDGFRFWSDVRRPKYKVCDCGWAPHLPRHYRLKGTARW